MDNNKTKTYDVGSVTVVSPENKELELSASFVVENADDYDEDYLNMIFGMDEEE